jgi:uracil-DNA glycosylase
MGGCIPESWRAVLEPVCASREGRRLGGWLQAQEEEGRAVYPPRGHRLRAFELTPLETVRVVILGQDPYHGPGQAHGLCFSVPAGVKQPPSLANIFRELEQDCGIPRASHGNLEHWARQGVLLLNNALTVEAGRAGSHAGRGWEALTDAAVTAVAAREAPSVFILWGSHAQGKAARIPELGAAVAGAAPQACEGDPSAGRGERARHLLIASPHPSPLSAHRGFFGSRPFSRANAFLAAQGRGTIDWALPA